jgi:hypothetical protein
MIIALFIAVLVLFGWALGVFNPLSGVIGFVKISTTTFAFTKWSAEMKCKIVSANNFTGDGYQQIVSGVTSATITVESDTYDEGNMAFTCGAAYTFLLGYMTGVQLSITVIIESITPTVDYNGGQPIKIVGQSNGSFTASIV